MTGILLGAVAGFVGGLFYGRNKANPAHAALFDLKRGMRAVGRMARPSAKPE